MCNLDPSLFRLDRQMPTRRAAEVACGLAAQQPGGRVIGERGVSSSFIEQDLSVIEAAAVAVEVGIPTKRNRKALAHASSGNSQRKKAHLRLERAHPGTARVIIIVQRY
jgi:PP-loop superfamily ATP-utilizing enzyme